MITGLMDGTPLLLLHLSSHSTICQLASSKSATRSSLFQAHRNGILGTVGKDDGEKQGQAICESVSWTHVESFCRALCSSLGEIRRGEEETEERFYCTGYSGLVTVQSWISGKETLTWIQMFQKEFFGDIKTFVYVRLPI